MKNTRLNSIISSSFIACALAIGSLASTQSASAQTIAKATIPFAFQTSSQTLPAGTYRVHRESPDLIRLEGPGKASGFVVMNAATKAKAPDHGMLVFDHTGGKYYLRQVWTAGNVTGLECPKSRAEKAATLVATNDAPVTTTTVELAFNSEPQK